MIANELIRVEHLNFTYKTATNKALNDLNFTIFENEWVSIIGHNGSGKSTLSRLLDGLLIPDPNPATKISVAGIELTNRTVEQVRQLIGIVFQNPETQFIGATVADDIAFALESKNVPRAEMIKRVKRAISDVGMQGFENAEPSTLSGGQKQRVAIAGVLASQPKVLILDESTSMLDPEGRHEIIQLIKQIRAQTSMTVISITHDVEEAAMSDRIIVLNDGEIVDSGRPEQVFSKAEKLTAIGLDVPFADRIATQLLAAGVDLAQKNYSEKELVEALCRLNSHM